MKIGDGALDWLRQAARLKLYITERNQDENIQVMSLAEFIVWVNQTFR